MYQVLLRHLRSGDLFLMANTHTVSGRKARAIPGNTPQARLSFKELCMQNVMGQCVALAASQRQAQEQCHVVLAGDWNVEASSVYKAMQRRPTGEDWWWVGDDRRDFIVSTCAAWQVMVGVVAHDKQHNAAVAQLQPTTEPVKLTPHWDFQSTPKTAARKRKMESGAEPQETNVGCCEDNGEIRRSLGGAH